MLKLGNENIKSLYLGETEIKKAYLGEELVFNSIPVYTVTVIVDPADYGTVTGAGQYKEGETCTLKATVSGTNQFVGWKDGDTVISTSDTYSFTVTGDVTLTATFKAFSVSFTSITTPIGNGGGVAFGNNVFVSSSNQNYYVNKSNDAVTFSYISLDSKFKAFHTAFGNGKFLIVGLYRTGTSTSTNRQSDYYSTDGTNWTLRISIAAGSTQSLSCLNFCNGKFFAAYGNKQYYYTTDGITWTGKNTLPSGPSTWYSFAYGDGIYVAVGNSNTAGYSLDGDNWTSSTLPSAGSWYSVAYGNGMFIAVNGSTISSNVKAAKSTDGGKTWYAITLPGNVPCKNVIFANGMFFIARYNAAQVFYGADGEHWSTATIPGVDATQWEGMAYGNGKLLITRTGYTNAAYAEIG